MDDKKFQKLTSNKIRFSLNLEIHVFFIKSANFILIFVLFYNEYKEKMLTIEIEDGHPSSLIKF